MVQFATTSSFALGALGALLFSIAPAPVAADNYVIRKSYQGKNFFDGWDFYNKNDNLTNGNVFYVSSKTASKNNLAYVNDAGQAIMRVDNTTKNLKFGDNRNSVRINSKDRFMVGSVWVADMSHTPFGCSVWPAWWSSALVWPQGGEIDTFEGVNGVTRHQMGLHTEPGCSWTNGTQTSSLVNATDCSYLANENEGCVVTNPTTSSYGATFANGGGGVWVTEFISSGIAMWFFNRTSVPSSLTAGATSLDTSTLGVPVANFTSTGCDVNTFFAAQTLIFNIALCGDYAGNADTFAQTCSGFCYQDYVLGDGSAYNDAYFAVNYVNVFGVQDRMTVISGASSTYRVSTALAVSSLLALASWLW